jgi:hypothetical protein
MTGNDKMKRFLLAAIVVVTTLAATFGILVLFWRLVP